MGGQSERTEVYLEYIPENVEEQPSEHRNARKDVDVFKNSILEATITSLLFHFTVNKKTNGTPHHDIDRASIY